MTRPEDTMTDDELLVYLREQFDEPTLIVMLWRTGIYRASVRQDPNDIHYFNEEFPCGETRREALLDCIRVHGHMMKREGMRR